MSPLSQSGGIFDDAPIAVRPKAPVAALAAALIAVLLYLPSFGNPLVWDDVIHIDRVRAGGFFEVFERPARQEYLRPVVLLSYQLQESLGLVSPSAYHAVNIAIHVLAALLLLSVLRELGFRTAVAAGGTLVFIAHPIQAAAVAYVSGRTDLLAAVFTLATLALVLRLRRAPQTSQRWMIPGALVCAVLAALSKEVGLAAPLLGAAACRVELPSRAPRAPVVAPLAMAAAGVLSVWLVLPPAVADGASVSAALRLRAAGTALASYLQLLVWPNHLHLERISSTGGGWAALPGAIVAGGTVVGVLWFFRRPNVVAFAVLALVFTYGPASNLVPIYPGIVEQWVFTPEHFLYLPLLVLGPLAAAALWSLARRPATHLPADSADEARVRRADAVAVLFGLAVAALAVFPVRALQADLSSDKTLFRAILAHSPSPRACFNLGVALLEEKEYEEAESVYERCATLNPRDAGMFLQLGVARQYLRDTIGARTAYATAAEIDPDDPLVWSNIASLDASLGYLDDAREGWQRSLELDPGFEPALHGLAKLRRLSRQPVHRR